MSDGLQEFAGRYAAMSEAELMELARSYDTLVEPAQEALRAEFSRRGLEPPVIDEPEQVERRDLVTIQSYRDLPAADLARGLLESAGIPAWIQDDNLVRVDWFWSNAVGGIRLQVDRTNAEAAREILAQPMPATIELGNGDEFAQPRCPQCGSIEIGVETGPREGVKLVALATFALPIPAGAPVWRCEACGARWKETDGAPA
jgi:predicted RNA-binding Zn-ribbon protein involved in translation (DUF1610 family)